MAEKPGFTEFIETVGADSREFVEKLHRELSEQGCKFQVKEAKSGYVASYVLNKKTIANYIFRKKGLIARIYADHIGAYLDVLENLPDGMAKSIQDAPICKRLADPNDCNPKCAMGYDFLLRGERLQRCRYNAFLFLVCGENAPFIEALLMNEARAGQPGCP